jgi:hypothetical protein
MSQTPTPRSELEPPYTIELGGTVQHRSVPSYARAISLAEAYVRHGTRRSVEVFDRYRTRVYVSETSTPA